MAWTDPSGRLSLSSSTDHGATWSTARTIGDGRAVVPGPWIVATGDRLRIAWYEETATHRFDFQAAEATVQDGGLGPLAQKTLTPSIAGTGGDSGRGNHPTTDYAHFAVGPKGQVVAIWNDGQEHERDHVTVHAFP
jgi:hypothetical protein